MKCHPIDSRVATRHRALSSTVAAIATAMPLLLGSSLASAETRGYVVSWFATATNALDFAANCPKAFAEQGLAGRLAANEKPRVDRAVVDGKTVAALDYPDAVQKDPNIEMVVGKYAYGFDLGGTEANKFIDPETHEKVDNQLWRAVGCTTNFQQAPPAMPYLEGQAWNSGYVDAAPAWAMQISGPNLNKDGPVTLTLDRTLAHLERDAVAGIRSDVTYVLDPSPRSHNVLSGEIKNGVLWIKSGEIYLEGSLPYYTQVDLKNAHMRIRSSDAGGKLVGYWGGYTDWHMWSYTYTARCAVADCVGTYRALEKLADADPDPVSGKNRMISVTWRMEAVPAFLATRDGKIVATATNDGLGGQVHETVASAASNGGAQTTNTAQH